MSQFRRDWSNIPCERIMKNSTHVESTLPPSHLKRPLYREAGKSLCPLWIVDKQPWSLGRGGREEGGGVKMRDVVAKGGRAREREWEEKDTGSEGRGEITLQKDSNKEGVVWEGGTRSGLLDPRSSGFALIRRQTPQTTSKPYRRNINTGRLTSRHLSLLVFATTSCLPQVERCS